MWLLGDYSYDELAHIRQSRETLEILQGTRDVSQFNALKGPVSFATWGVVGHFFDWNLQVLRFTTFLFSLGTYFCFWLLCKHNGHEYQGYALVSVFFLPKLFLVAFLVMTEMVALFFLLAAYLVYESARENKTGIRHFFPRPGRTYGDRRHLSRRESLFQLRNQ